MKFKVPEIKSWKNLEAAFAGESMAYQKYRYFAKIARKNGDEEIAKLFEETAEHETRHAEGHLRTLYPMNEMSTKDLLEIAMEGERFEYTEMYPQYAQTAKEERLSNEWVEHFEEGIEDCKEHTEMFRKRLEKMNKVFTGLAKVEKEHHDNYQQALNGFVASAGFDVSNDYLKGDDVA